ncbi:MAG TPA: carboxypeptidase-like regulatory domain-containing protein, partial [Bacteroidota bacterium]|nr:carboxypeptidase-like regulatory domain-containing protein [Bacteroidota bacterium]
MRIDILIRTAGRIASVLLLILLHVAHAGAAGTLRGRVTDRSTGDPLPGANVIVANTSIGASTGLDGEYVIRGVPAGPQTVRVAYVGYATFAAAIQVDADSTAVMDVRLTAEAIQGETVVVTAQALGQNEAINQQLSSNTITNIVSSARIKELPDVNAAESIGRLPGVAINRSNGEASTVVIRGLSAKYNLITVNGVQLPATGGDDRSVDLSLISSNILDGIEVKKANTADMEASALGGTVDLKLREAPAEPALNLSAQAGYNNLQNYYGNYAFTGNWSRRYLDGDLGVILSFNADKYNRAADKFQGTYLTTRVHDVVNVGISNVQLRDENVTRKRTGGSLLLDYDIPLGKVTANGFLNQMEPDATYRINQPDREHGSHYYNYEENRSKSNLFTAALGLRQDFDLFKYD